MAVLIRKAGSVPVVSPIFPSASNCSAVKRIPNAFDFLGIVTLGYFCGASSFLRILCELLWDELLFL